MNLCWSWKRASWTKAGNGRANHCKCVCNGPPPPCRWCVRKAARAATSWGCPISDDLVRDLVQRVGNQIEATTFRASPPPPQEPPFTLVIMMDGWRVRERGPDWGARSGKHDLERAAWHEVKSAVIYRLEQRAQSAGGRGFLIEKFVVACEPETAPVDFGAAVQAEARRRGLGRAQRVLIVIDGAVWLWHVAADRFAEATLELDFHHASQYLWAIAHELFGEGTPEAQAWVRPLLGRLKHGGEARVLQTLAALLTDAQNPVSERVQTEVAYFQTHREHVHYQRIRRQRGAQRQRGDGVLMQRVPGPLAAHRAVLESGRTAPPAGRRRGRPQPGLRNPRELKS